MEPETPRSHLTPAAFAYAGASILALLALPHLQAPLETFGARNAGRFLLGTDPARSLLWGLGAGVLLSGLGQVFTNWTSWGRRLSRLLQQVIGSLHPVDALLIAALSGFAEELIFRGILLPYAGLAVSSALFGLAHLIPRRGLWPWSVWAVAAGVALGWLALSTGGLLAPILAHFVVNGVGLLLLSRDSR